MEPPANPARFNRTASFEEQFRLWEALWEACDFSWDGLADAGWERGDDANFAQKLKRWRWGQEELNLQQYWRRVLPWRWRAASEATDDELNKAGLSVSIDEELWHVVYLSDYEADPSNSQHRLELTLRNARQGQADPTYQLQGARARGIDAAIQHIPDYNQPINIALRAEMAEFRHARFTNSKFLAPANFSRAVFQKEQTAFFDNTQFKDEMDFSGTIFGGGADFSNSILVGKVDFKGTPSRERVVYEIRNLKGRADFGRTVFHQKSSFFRAIFGDFVNFQKSVFQSPASFFLARFGGDASFYEKSFYGRSFFEKVDFERAALFTKAKFHEQVNLWKAKFHDRCGFREVFFKDSRFESSVFEGGLDADRAKFTGRTNFRAAEIKGYSNFEGCTWPEKAKDQEGAFEGCRFRDVADFKTEGLSAFALFDGAEFKGRVLLTDPGAEAEDSLFRQALAAADAAATAKPEDADRRFAALAGGLRTLKLAMAAQGDRDREQRFFRYEVQARARRTDEPWTAKAAARLYGLTSDYGASVGRPLLSICVLVMVFAAIYGAFGINTGMLHWGPSRDGPWQALELSLSNSFRPFSIFDMPQPENKSFWAGLLGRTDGVSFAMRLLGTLQAIATIILLFLVGVALRRKFQIG